MKLRLVRRTTHRLNEDIDWVAPPFMSRKEYPRFNQVWDNLTQMLNDTADEIKRGVDAIARMEKDPAEIIDMLVDEDGYLRILDRNPNVPQGLKIKIDGLDSIDFNSINLKRLGTDLRARFISHDKHLNIRQKLFDVASAKVPKDLAQEERGKLVEKEFVKLADKFIDGSYTITVKMNLKGYKQLPYGWHYHPH